MNSHPQNRAPILFAAAWCCLLATFGVCDVLVLKNGEALSGTFSRIRQNTLVFRTSLEGQMMTPMADVTSVSAASIYYIAMTNGVVYYGRLGVEKERQVVYPLSGGDAIPINPAAIDETLLIPAPALQWNTVSGTAWEESAGRGDGQDGCNGYISGWDAPSRPFAFDNPVSDDNAPRGIVLRGQLLLDPADHGAGFDHAKIETVFKEEWGERHPLRLESRRKFRITDSGLALDKPTDDEWMRSIFNETDTSAYTDSSRLSRLSLRIFPSFSPRHSLSDSRVVYQTKEEENQPLANPGRKHLLSTKLRLRLNYAFDVREDLIEEAP